MRKNSAKHQAPRMKPGRIRRPRRRGGAAASVARVVRRVLDDAHPINSFALLTSLLVR